MRFRIVPSTADGRQQLLTTYLINESLAIDAGAIGVGLTRKEQLQIRSIVLTHSHLDHIFSLPLFLTDLFEEWSRPVNIYATPSDYDAVREHLFNPRVWIPLDHMENSKTRLIEYHPIKSEESFFAEGIQITPIPVTHTVLTHGLLVEDEKCALLFTSDTGPTERIWEAAQTCTKLRAVFIDVSFPARMTELARVSCHHSTTTLVEEAAKISPDVDIYAIHLKPAYRTEVETEISALNDPRIKLAHIGRQYEF
jgi:ribonuclease BN (tRNA processing enzyme)